MHIERDPSIRFHELGTLISVTRWINAHDEGLAEWLKNARRAFQPDRGNVEESHRSAVLLFKDADAGSSAMIGLLDVGGATLEDVTRWSTWQDPEASSRNSGYQEEETQGNGGKAYMYRLFAGPAWILGVKESKRNCKGFDGDSNTLERGTPGFMPDAASGRDLPISSWEAELESALTNFGLHVRDLPREVQISVAARAAFTLVEGVDPVSCYKGRIDAEDLVQRILWHDQSTLAVQQMRLYAVHNGRPMNHGKPLELEPIAPYPGFEQPMVHQIPDLLPDSNGVGQSTNLGGQRSAGRLILYTSRENMLTAYKKLKPRWKVTYRTQTQMIGSKPVSELVPATPGSQFVYATVELAALEPDYVELGRKRPNDGPLVQAIDIFIAERIRSIAKEINDRRRHDLDQEALDEVHDENRKLNNFKNQFLPTGEMGGDGGTGKNGKGPRKGPGGQPRDYGELAESIELEWDSAEVLRIGKGAVLHVGPILKPQVRDAAGRHVPNVEIEWHSADPHVLDFENGGIIVTKDKGTTEIWAHISGSSVDSTRIRVEVWVVDHVLLTPRTLEIPLGKHKQVIVEVTNDEAQRATNVFLNWKHDADDPLIVRIRPTGWVTGNRVGRTTVIAGAGDPARGGVWARIGAEVTVVPNPDQPGQGGGFPELRLTGRDTDPATGEIREGDPDQPALWQEVSDYQNNIWWLNIESPEAAYLFAQRQNDIRLWRSFHAQKTVEMVIQVHMREEFDAKGEAERPDLWNRHKATLEIYQVRLMHDMWDKLQNYVDSGGGLE